jgi:glycosyltransferase involved in cell wall biosynthesis
MTVMVSVIVPTYNRPGYLARALASIRAQTYRDYEIIVVNDGGEDVARLCELFGPVNYLALKRNMGLPTARNNGIRRANGRFVAYLDDDDMWLPRHLEKLVAFRLKSRCRLVYSDSFYWFDESSYQLLLSLDYSKEELHRQNLTPVCSILHDRDLWDEAGRFNQALPNHEDYELWLRMSEITSFEHLAEVTALYSKRTGSEQMSMNAKFMAEQRRIIQEKYRIKDLDVKKSMKVKAIVSFTSGSGILVQQGDVFELPEGVDWLKAGFVVPYVDLQMERTILPDPEKRKNMRVRVEGKEKYAQN